MVDLGVAEGEQGIREPDLVHDFQDRRVEGIAAELPIEISVPFKQRHGDAVTRQEQRQHRPRRPTADDATGGLFNVIVHRSGAQIWFSVNVDHG